MSNHLMTNPVIRYARTLGRRVGLTKLAAKAIQGRGYEEKFSQALLSAVEPGDTVWDVGANIGYYTAIFSERVNGTGTVVAFEPAASTFAELNARISGHDNIITVNAALSDQAGEADLAIGQDKIAATSQVMVDGKIASIESEKVETVKLERGDRLIASGKLPAPTVMKVDVEGHELNVIQGLGEHLASPGLRRVLMEVHFGILDATGRSGDARKIVGTLEAAGFEVHWTDASHINAHRRPT